MNREANHANYHLKNNFELPVLIPKHAALIATHAVPHVALGVLRSDNSTATAVLKEAEFLPSKNYLVLRLKGC